MAINYKDENGVIHSLIPDMNNIDDAAASSSTTYSSSKTNQLLSGKQNVEEGKGLSSNDFTDDDKTAILNSAIPSTSTTSPITDSADAMAQGLTIKGKSRVSKNLFDITSYPLTESAWIYAETGVAVENEAGTACTLDYIPCALYVGQTLTLNKRPAGSNPGIAFYNASKIFILGIKNSGSTEGTPWTFTVPTGAMFMRFSTVPNNQQIQLELGSTATEYEPYFSGIKSIGDDGLTVTTANSDNTLTTSAEFITALPLRGVSDAVRDKLICTAESKQVEKVCGKVRLADLSWASSGNYFYTTIDDMPLPISGGHNGVCNKYQIYQGHYQNMPDKSITYGNTTISGTKQVDIKDTDYTTVSDFVASLGDAELVYELATPVTTPLTTTEISAFRGLRTYDNTTNVTITDSPDFELDYLKNSGNGQAVADIQTDLQEQIDGLKSKIEKNHFCYSYKIDLSDSNPATCVKPHFDTRYGCDNFSFTSAKMNYTTGVFDYGSWEGFIRRIARPCMLKYDGTVDYYLDPDDYSKKITGEASDVADVNYQGNAMVELEKLYFKRYTYNGIQYCFIADRKLDKSFKCYAHHDKYGKELDYIYRACYDGMYDGTRLRSISGIDYHNLDVLTAGYIMSNATRQEEMNFAKANNVSTEKGEGWNILHKSEWDYINDILILISMSTDTQGTFGRGRDSGYVSTTNTGIISTGTMNDKGLFWGKNDSTAGVKVLGIENHWANIFKSCAGWFNDKGTQKVKYTYGTEDGSTGEGYNITADGYISISGATPTKGDGSTSGGGYITAWQYGDYGILPYETISGASNKYLCDYIWFRNTATCFALVGGHSNDGLVYGAFYSNLGNDAGNRNWDIGAALSYKPLSAA